MHVSLTTPILTRPKRAATSVIEFLPAVSIILPFCPVISAKKNLECCLNKVLARVEDMLTVQYSFKTALPVLVRLKQLFAGLNFNTSKKSIAIFVSPVMDRVYYLEVEMEENIVIDPSFKISDMISCKKEKREFLMLILNETFSNMYLGNGTSLNLIKSNKITHTPGCENMLAARSEDRADTKVQQETVIKKFLSQMDRGLSIILHSYALPVFVIGPQKLLEHFKTITKNEESLLQFIHGDYGETAGSELYCVMEHVVSHWKSIKQGHLLKQVIHAKAQNNLRIGLRDTLKASMNKKVKLLVVERQFIDFSQISKPYSPLFKTESAVYENYFIKNDVDEVIKNVFESGGDVEFIDNGLLKKFRHIALIEKRS